MGVYRLDEKRWVAVASDPAIRLHDILYLVVNKIVERVDVLLDQALDFQECREEIPFVLNLVRNVAYNSKQAAYLCGIYGVCQTLSSIERLKQSRKSLDPVSEQPYSLRRVVVHRHLSELLVREPAQALQRPFYSKSYVPRTLQQVVEDVRVRMLLRPGSWVLASDSLYGGANLQSCVL